MGRSSARVNSAHRSQPLSAVSVSNFVHEAQAASTLRPVIMQASCSDYCFRDNPGSKKQFSSGLIMCVLNKMNWMALDSWMRALNLNLRL
ncbi:hypothetical protein L211DRAFT_479494 [Terfezia boudieri ATCC MYA-4762]|uniref:Uncharacterized protein n=1 Tax=Terfezia boudieri ATCC MYA-4762 TaxID=1051890 RepID=A0A3N4LYN2_9PEZI|nr:hypothetical protein L211DRAFT_479494 [Terfezia boudieri ATCC MYA-4762]